MKRLNSFIVKELKCIVCGTVTFIQRRKARNRGAGHIKHIYCHSCFEVTAHEEQE